MLKIEIKTSGAAYRDSYETDKKGNYVLDKNATELIRNLKEIINKLEKRVDNLENKLKSVIIERESDK